MYFTRQEFSQKQGIIFTTTKVTWLLIRTLEPLNIKNALLISLEKCVASQSGNLAPNLCRIQLCSIKLQHIFYLNYMLQKSIWLLISYLGLRRLLSIFLVLFKSQFKWYFTHQNHANPKISGLVFSNLKSDFILALWSLAYLLEIFQL